MRVKQLRPGQRFSIDGMPYKLVWLGHGSAYVERGGYKVKTFVYASGRQRMVSSVARLHIALETEVDV